MKLPIICPESYRAFLSELARNSPVCGLVQLGGNQDIYKLLHQLASTELNIQDSTSHSQLQAHTPVLAEFICKCPKEDGRLPSDVRALFADILLSVKIDATFSGHTNPATHYLPIRPSPWSFFPALPLELETTMPTRSHHQVMPIHAKKRHMAIHT